VTGGSHPRFAPSELDLDKSFRSRRRGALLYRHEAGAWVEAGRFGSIAEAQTALDEEAGRAHGDFGAYRVVPVPRPRRITVGLVLACLVLALAWVWLAVRLFG
jgi:hypothetical protein